MLRPVDGQQASQYRRRISPLEWWFLAYPPGLPSFNQMVVEGSGDLDTGSLARAVATVAAVYPGACVVRRGKHWVDVGRVPPVREIGSGPLDTIRFSSTEALRQQPRDDLPTSEVLLLPGTPTTLVFRTFHGVMDATATFGWITDVFRALRGEQAAGMPSPLTEAQLLERITAPEPRCTVSGSNTSANLADAAGDLAWPSPLGRLPTAGGRGFLWRRRTVDGTHPALVAKLATTITAVCGLRTGRFLVPVDLRRHDPAIRSSANLTRPIRLDVRAEESWDAAHGELLSALARRGELHEGVDASVLSVPLPALRAQMAALDAFAAKANRYTGLATLSHLGRIDPAALSGGGFDAETVYSLPNSGPGGPPEFNLVEIGDRTEITLGWQEGPGVTERAEALLDLITGGLVPRAHRLGHGSVRHGSGPDATADADADICPDTDVVRLFRAQARATPDAIAVSGQDAAITYAELDRRSDAVAEELLRHHTGPDSVVGLLTDRSATGVVGVWGVLKAGGAYLPIDPRYPDQRVHGLLDDARARLCLVERPHDERDVLPEGCLPLVLDDLPLAPRGRVEVPVSPGDLAWVIYTSGSTGRPKGVEVEHRGVLNYVRWATREFGIDARSRMPWLTSPSFDPSGTSIFLPLLAGGTVVVKPGELNHVTLRYLLEESGADTATLTPSHLDLVGRLGLRPAGFRSLIVVGEHLRVTAAARARETFGPQCRIINEYGPTEITIACTCHVYDPERDTGATVPIGLPLENNGVRLFDEQRRPVPAGEVGEMFLTGAQLARGYLGRPELDRERFVRLADRTRAYRTGDLARVLPSGELELIGRNDDQVKVLGHRIEPAEIASVLEEHPEVLRAAVIARTSSGARGRVLCGYVLPAGGHADQGLSAALEAYLAERLPHYMVPAAIVPVADLPLVLNGKIDWRALPDPFRYEDPAEQGAAEQGAAPAPVPALTLTLTEGDPVLDAVIHVWACALGLSADQIGSGADFYRLGGDSLAMLGMIGKVAAEVVGAEREDVFMAEFVELIREPTLERVGAAARRARSASALLPVGAAEAAGHAAGSD